MFESVYTKERDGSKVLDIRGVPLCGTGTNFTISHSLEREQVNERGKLLEYKGPAQFLKANGEMISHLGSSFADI